MDDGLAMDAVWVPASRHRQLSSKQVMRHRARWHGRSTSQCVIAGVRARFETRILEHDAMSSLSSGPPTMAYVLLAVLLAATCTGAAEVEVTAGGGQQAQAEAAAGDHTHLLSRPRITYGTAWKQDDTSDLVYDAITAGFRHIDTACQPKHYNEKGVGEGWTRAARDLGLTRKDLWLQTKYTSLDGQDLENPIPYDKEAPLEEQVRQSLAKSFENLQTKYIDSLVMHGPEDTWEKMSKVWGVFESFVDEGKVGQIGISNFYDPAGVKYLYNMARIKPAVVQNRFYADSNYDTKIRAFCIDHNMEYQSFWTLGANRHALDDERIIEMARKIELTPETLMYAFVLALGITPLDGTRSKEHMAEDIALLKRIRSGEKIFDENELALFSDILGLNLSDSE